MFLIGPLFHPQVFFFTSFRTDSLFSFTCFFFYIFHTGPLSSFTCFFTCFMQAPFFHFFLHVSYTSAFFHLLVFYMFHTGPIFHLHVFYMFLTCPLFFPFTWFLQGFKRSISRLRVAFGRIIYTFFTGLSEAIYMFFTTEDTVKVRKIIYRFLHVLQIMIIEKDNVNQYLQNTYMLYQKL